LRVCNVSDRVPRCALFPHARVALVGMLIGVVGCGWASCGGYVPRSVARLPDVNVTALHAVVHAAGEITAELVARLPRDFIVKGTHGSGMIIKVTDGAGVCVKTPCNPWRVQRYEPTASKTLRQLTAPSAPHPRPRPWRPSAAPPCRCFLRSLTLQ